jgi:hypothetical protein
MEIPSNQGRETNGLYLTMRWPRGKAQFSLVPDNLVEGHLLVEPSIVGEVKGIVTYDVKSRLLAEQGVPFFAICPLNIVIASQVWARGIAKKDTPLIGQSGSLDLLKICVNDILIRLSRAGCSRGRFRSGLSLSPLGCL